MNRVANYAYNKENIIGHGVDGVVYKGVNLKTKENVAIKEMTINNDGFTPEILKELSFYGKAMHPNIPELYDVYLVDQCVLLIMEYCSDNLLNLITDNKIANNDIPGFINDIASVVNYVHEIGYVHNDLSLKNFVKANNNMSLKLIDFAKTTKKHRYKKFSDNKPTLYVCPPEVILDDEIKNPKSIDVWGVGCILYCIVTKSPLFYGNTEDEQLQQIIKHIGVPPQSSSPRSVKAMGSKKPLGLNNSHLHKCIKQMLQLNHKKRKDNLKNIMTMNYCVPNSFVPNTPQPGRIDFCRKVKMIEFMSNFNKLYQLSDESIFITLKNITKVNNISDIEIILLFLATITLINEIKIKVDDIAKIVDGYMGHNNFNHKHLLSQQFNIMEKLCWDIDVDNIFSIVKRNDPNKHAYIGLLLECHIKDEKYEIVEIPNLEKIIIAIVNGKNHIDKENVKKLIKQLQITIS